MGSWDVGSRDSAGGQSLIECESGDQMSADSPDKPPTPEPLVATANAESVIYSWGRASPHLDHALDLAEPEKAGYLAALREQDPALAAVVEELLADHQALVKAHFLEQAPGVPSSLADDGRPIPGILSGRILGEFRLREIVGAGGFGEVYLAEQPELQRDAVVKVLRRDRVNEKSVQRFLREARLASRLDHPYAAHVYAFGAEPDGVCWIAMERVRGSTLRALLDSQGPMPLERFVPLLERICEVVQSAHEQGIVHRDLKPENVMVIARAGRLLPKLLDFGIARALDAPEDELLPQIVSTDERDERDHVITTKHGAVFGSPPYMAPELWGGAHNAGPSSDQYALGALAYEALTGRLAFPGPSVEETARAHEDGDVVPLGSSFPAALELVLRRALARQPSLRHANVLGFAQAFREATGISAGSVEIPQLEGELQQRFLGAAPQPIADAVAAYHAARNAHQAREALRGLVKIAAWYVGILATACRTRAGSAGAPDSQEARVLLRELRKQGLTPAGWISLARHFTEPFAHAPDTFPIPELVLLLHPGAGRCDDFAACLEGSLSDALPDSSEDAATQAITRELPAVTALLASLTFLLDYPLIVARDGRAAESWMGRSGPRPTIVLGRDVPPGCVAVIDQDCNPLLGLWPLVQVASPMPGHPEQLFLLAGSGREAARLVSSPLAFEHRDADLWDWFREQLLAGDDPASQAAVNESPYRGLSPYAADDARWFFGRERETEVVVNRLRAEPLVAVVGPSGIGKSSFVHAGVAPSLNGWRVLTLRPGRSPLAQLGLTLGQAGLEVDGQISAWDEGTVPDRLRHWAAGCGDGVLVVVDQFEEVFTLGCPAEERELFVRLLLAWARTAADHVRVIITLRDDFLIRTQQLPGLDDALARGLQLLGPVRDAALERILLEPARRVGYEFEDGLAARMVAAAAGTHAAIALLSFTAARLWDLRDRHFHQLPSRAYDAIGGVGGAVARHADDTIDRMPATERALVRRAFRHLVTFEGTRAVLGRLELEQLLGGGPETRRLIERLLEARLLTSSEDERGETVIELVHEALLEAWPRLVAWRREDLEGTRLHEQLRSAARQWDERGRPRGLLWRGDALAEYQVWRKRHGATLTPLESTFANVSVADAARGRKIRRTVVALAAVMTAAFVVILWRSTQAERHARVEAVRLLGVSTSERERADRQTLALLEDRGRDELERGRPFRAAVYLAEAFKHVPKSLRHRALLSEAVRSMEAVAWTAHAHRSPVRSISFSYDDKHVLTAASDGTVKILNASSGRLIRALRSEAQLTCSAFSPDARKVVTASMDGQVRIWNADTGERIGHGHGPPGDISGCPFSPDGRQILTLSQTGPAKVLDAADGSLVRVLSGTSGGVSFGAYSPDGRRILVSKKEGTALVFEAHTGRRSYSFDGSAGGTWHGTASFSPDGRHIAVSDHEGVLYVRDARSGRLIRELRGNPAPDAVHVEWSPDGLELVSGGSDGMVRQWAVATGESQTLLRIRNVIVTAGFVKSGNMVLAVADDFVVRLLHGRHVAFAVDLPTRLGTGSDRAIAISRSGDQAVAATGDGTIHFLKLGGRFSIAAHRGHALGRVQYSPLGERLAIAEVGGAVSVVDIATRTVSFQAHTTQAFRVVWAPDGFRLLTVPFTSTGGLPRLWDPRTGALIGELKTGARRVYSATFSPTGEVIATAGRDDTVSFWNGRTGGAQGKDLEGAGQSVAFSPDGRRLATGSSKIRIWDVPSLNRVRELEGHPDTRIDTLAFDAAGGRLVSAGWDDHLAKIWDVSTGKLLVTLEGHGGRLMAAEFSPDGKYVATGAYDPAVNLWDASNGDLLRTIQGPNHSLDFSPDGTKLATGIGRTVVIWDITLDQRSPDELAAYVANKSPWKLVDGRLVMPDSPQPESRSSANSP
jgi:WD40 repeat protein/tRNA A-37 threonylcarbamoyl transferase component Bud32